MAVSEGQDKFNGEPHIDIYHRFLVTACFQKYAFSKSCCNIFPVSNPNSGSTAINPPSQEYTF